MPHHQKLSLFVMRHIASKIYHPDFGYESTLRCIDESYEKLGLGAERKYLQPVDTHTLTCRLYRPLLDSFSAVRQASPTGHLAGPHSKEKRRKNQKYRCKQLVRTLIFCIYSTFTTFQQYQTHRGNPRRRSRAPCCQSTWGSIAHSSKTITVRLQSWQSRAYYQ